MILLLVISGVLTAASSWSEAVAACKLKAVNPAAQLRLICDLGLGGHNEVLC